MAQTKDGNEKRKVTIAKKYGLTEDGKSKQHILAGKLGGKAKVPKGFAMLTPEQREIIKRKAIQARWGKK